MKAPPQHSCCGSWIYDSYTGKFNTEEGAAMKEVVIGMAGAGRGTELHMGGYERVHGVKLRYKHIPGTLRI